MILAGESILPNPSQHHVHIKLPLDEENTDYLGAIFWQMKNLYKIDFDDNGTTYCFLSKNNNPSIFITLQNHNSSIHRDYFLGDI